MLPKHNTNTHLIDLNLPSVSLNTNTFYPFRSKNEIGTMKWYENISTNYSMTAQNTINSTDSTIFNRCTLTNMQNGMNHNIPISSSIKILKYFTLTNSVNYSESWYLKTVRQRWDTVNVANKDSIYQRVKDSIFLRTDNVNGFAAARQFSFSSSLTTTIYGMAQFKYGFIRAIRHVMQPTVSFTYNPDFSNPFWGNMRTYTDTSYNKNKIHNIESYSIFQGEMYGAPPTNKSGKVNFGITNSLEMKVRSNKDTITGTKKIVLIENLTISTSYDLAAHSLN